MYTYIFRYIWNGILIVSFLFNLYFYSFIFLLYYKYNILTYKF